MTVAMKGGPFVIRIVTDSTSDLTPALLQEYGVEDVVHIVPLTVHFGDEEFRDGVDLARDTFFEMLKTRAEMPRSSQPSPAAFAEAYQQASNPGDTVLSIHISGKLSGTHQSAALAARQFQDRDVEVIDTRSVSLGLGLMVLAAAKEAKEGKSKEEILAQLRRRIAAVRIYFVVDTLEYLQKNGRIGKAQAFVGGLLNVKPLLSLEDGVVSPVEKVRGKAKAKERMIERVLETVPPGSVEMGAILHAAAAEEGAEIAARLSERYGDVKFHVEELGPTVGTHAGPGTVGVVVFGR